MTDAASVVAAASPPVLSVAIAAGLLAFLFVAFVNDSPYLPGPNPDAAYYVAGAESMASTGRYTAPITTWNDPSGAAVPVHFPPGFSAVMALPASLGVPLSTSIVVILALSAAVSVGMMALVVGRVSGPVAGAVAAALMLVMPPFVRLHVAIWSEPLFFAVMRVSIDRMVRRPDRPLLYGCVIAAASLVRYVGVGF